MVSDFQRVEVLEEQFKNRYNRDVEIWRKIKMREDDDAKYDWVVVQIKTPNNVYEIEEKFKLNQFSDCIYLRIGDKEHIYKSLYDGDMPYLRAETHVADLIGEE